MPCPLGHSARQRRGDQPADHAVLADLQRTCPPPQQAVGYLSLAMQRTLRAQQVSAPLLQCAEKGATGCTWWPKGQAVLVGHCVRNWRIQGGRCDNIVLEKPLALSMPMQGAARKHERMRVVRAGRTDHIMPLADDRHADHTGALDGRAALADQAGPHARRKRLTRFDARAELWCPAAIRTPDQDRENERTILHRLIATWSAPPARRLLALADQADLAGRSVCVSNGTLLCHDWSERRIGHRS